MQMKRLLVFMGFAAFWAIIGLILVLSGSAVGAATLGITGMVTALMIGADFVNVCICGGTSFFSDTRN